MSNYPIYFFSFGSLSVILILILVGCKPDHISQKPLAHKGILDLRTFDLNTLGVFECDGEWDFYWQKLYTPQELELKRPVRDAYLTVPGVWNDTKIGEEVLDGVGYGTYHLRILLDKTYQELALKLQDAGTALKFYVGDSLMMLQGKVATEEGLAEPDYKPQIIVFQTDSTVLDLTIQVSNFDYRKGGLWLPISIGTTYNVVETEEVDNMIDFFLLGSLIIIGFYHIIFFIVRPKESASLFFGLVCLTTALRITVTDNIIILKFIDLPWSWLVTLEYLTFYCGALLFVVFVYKLFPKFTNKPVFKGFISLTSAFSLFVFLTPVKLFNLSLGIFEFLVLLMVLYIVYILYREVRNGHKTVWIFIAGFIVFIISFVNDIFYNSGVIKTDHLISVGLYIFIICQSLLLAIHFSSGFNESEKLSQILDQTNKNLEKLVASRTESLVEANYNLEKKHKQITDSINYALRIQIAILPKQFEIKQALPESFIFLKPRDVVSGDFYWLKKCRNKTFIALVDCIGHGVPGAFISFLAYGFLNEAVEKRGLDDPKDIVRLILDGIKKIMGENQKYDTDYVDIGLCVIDHTADRLSFVSARRPLIYIQQKPNEELELQTVSNRHQKNNQFHIHLKGQTNFYLFSDGYTDQFGSPNNKKFGLRNLKTLLLSIYDKPMAEQHEIIEDVIDRWKAEEKQIDDILVIGFRC